MEKAIRGNRRRKTKIRRPFNNQIIPEKPIEYAEEQPEYSLKHRGSIRLSFIFSAEAPAKAGYHAKKNIFYKEQEHKEAYLEKIKDIPKEKLVYIDETDI